MKVKLLTIAIATLLIGGSAYAGDDLLGSVSLKGVPKNTVVSMNPDAADLANPQPAMAPQQSAPSVTAAQGQLTPPGLPPRQGAAPAPAAAATKTVTATAPVRAASAPAAAPAAKAPAAAPARAEAQKSIVASVASTPVAKLAAAAPTAAATKTAAAPSMAPAVVTNAAAPTSVPAIRQAPAPAVAQAPAPAVVLIPSAPARRLKVVLTDREIAFQQQEEELIRQKRLLVLQAEIAELNKKISGATEPTEAPAPPPIPMPMNVLDIAEQSPVEVISTWGGDGVARNADVLVEGKRRTVRAGEVLPSGWRVTDVSRSSVTIQRGREKKTVPVRS